jgi:hypothetical protein
MTARVTAYAHVTYAPDDRGEPTETTALSQTSPTRQLSALCVRGDAAREAGWVALIWGEAVLELDTGERWSMVATRLPAGGEE